MAVTAALRRGPLSVEELISLNQEIAGMARAGLPLDQGLTALAQDMKRGRLRDVTQQLGDDLKAGKTLPQALMQQKGRLPSYYAALLEAGIRSGRLAEVLGSLTMYSRSVADLRSSLMVALLYPAIILVLGLTLLGIVASVILPEFADVFRNFRLRLPLLTEALLTVGRHPFLILVLPAGIIVGLVVGLRWVIRSSPTGRVRWARFIYALPIFGSLIRSARLAAFVELLGILVDRSIPLPEALRLSAEASSDPLLLLGSRQVEADLGQGKLLGEALWQQMLVPELVVWMITYGEKQGTLGATLHQVAQVYRRQTELRADLLRTVLPSLVIVFLAVFLGTCFILGLLTPMYGLLEGLGGFKSGLSK
jgi:type II secretory pathway component PulF